MIEESASTRLNYDCNTQTSNWTSRATATQHVNNAPTIEVGDPLVICDITMMIRCERDLQLFFPLCAYPLDNAFELSVRLMRLLPEQTFQILQVSPNPVDVLLFVLA